MNSARVVLGVGVVVSLVLTAAVWAGGFWLGDVRLSPDQGASWYYWKLPEPTFWTRASAWAGYAAHQLVGWGLIYYAQRHVRRYTGGLHPVNVVALIAHLGFIALHEVQTQVFYDGLAQDVSIFSSQGSVILLLIVVLIMENRRRGMFFGRPAPISAEITRFFREYHGYLFSWAAIYTFWYHPMETTSGHLIGFAYMFLLLLQGSLFFTRAHTDRWWTLTLELLVAVHGTLVAVMNSGPDGMWPMFLFGFLGVFVITQMHGLGLSRTVRWVLAALYLAAAVAVYSGRSLLGLNEIVRIPLIEYLVVAVLALLTWVVLRLVRRRKRELVGNVRG
ncbi:hypothetical protein QFW96_17120 [Saccharopolyspora sp. TS4A08]|uniref:Serine active site containing 1-like protein n=1 Tax=Saccharopolyspora ipomoeae TaxID=3042027 RepID=A0ABT6PQS4_9PSEU|nr:hypothetical protein [Saccharopolyspora sp. TS4A08]MDI2030355.1 hypothetical protein [Saccharopolyspora sp. TS4A08]